MKSENRPSNSAPASVTCEQRKEPRKNAIPNKSDCGTPKTEIKCLDLPPVSPCSTGEGLPYAPVDWPRPGDNWRWKVGRRISLTGFFFDRFLYPPARLRKPRCRKQIFSGRMTLAQYIRTEFPGEDADAFLASFSWKVRAKNQNCSQVNTAPCPRNIPHKMKEEKEEAKERDDEEEDTTHTNTRKRKKKPAPAASTFRRQTRQSFKRYFPSKTKQEVITIDLTQDTETTNSSTKDTRSASQEFENDQVSSNQMSVSSARYSIGTSHSHVARKEIVTDARQEPVETKSEDPEHYLNSLFQDPSSPAVGNEIAEAQMKLSSLLAMDFSRLISTENLTELKNLLSKIQEDRHLSLNQLLKLHMIEEIPLIGKYLLEAKQDMETDECFADLDTNIANLISLNKEYKQLKDKTAQVQATIDSNVLAKREIEDRIVQLQSQSAEHANNIEVKIVIKNEMLSAQRSMAHYLSSVIKRVELGKSKQQQWELKKADAAKLVAEVAAKYAS